jgi:branched-chain amino acid transport system ATP-binding protein
LRDQRVSGVPEAAVLSVEAVTVNFGGLSVLDAVSLTASSGEIVGLIGPNGAGKTTMFNVICGFVRPASGRITWRGRELRRQHPHDLAALGISRTLQGVGLFPHLTVLENVVVGLTPKVRAGLFSSMLGLWGSSRDERRLRDRAMESLERLNLAGYAARMPGTLPYPVQKRVGLARALVADAALVLMDEPASGLSASDITELAELLGSLRGHMGVLIVEHDMDLVMATCDRIVVLDFGRVIATGPPDEIRANPAVTTAYLGEPLEREPGHAGG